MARRGRLTIEGAYRIATRQTLEFEAAFGGVPVELLFDQLKAVIIDDQREIGGKLLENSEFLRFAAHCGFRIRACRPYLTSPAP